MALNYLKVSEEIETLKEQGEKAFWTVLASKYGKSPSALESWYRREKLKSKISMLLEDDEKDNNLEEIEEVETRGEGDEEDIPEYRAKTETKFDEEGNVKYVSSERVVKMVEEEEKSPEFVLRAHGFDPSLWVITSMINNFWQGMRKHDRGAATLYQSKITVKPKSEPTNITLGDIEHFFKNFDSKYVYPLSYGGNLVFKDSLTSHRETLVIPLADPHFGNEEEGYSTEEKIKKLTKDILTKLSLRPVSKIVVVGLGDILHVDTEGGTTTSGTQVGERGMIYTYWEKALISMIGFLSELSVHAPVEYVSVSGNHDRVNGFTLSKALEYAMLKSNLNVSFDTSFSHRKYKTIGSSVFGFTHGDMPSKNQGHVLQAEERKSFGESKYAYLLMGHLHHISIKDENNVVLMTLPSITEVDYWHKQNGYVGSWRGTLAYVVDDEDGIIETWHISA